MIIPYPTLCMQDTFARATHAHSAYASGRPSAARDDRVSCIQPSSNQMHFAYTRKIGRWLGQYTTQRASPAKSDNSVWPCAHDKRCYQTIIVRSSLRAASLTVQEEYENTLIKRLYDYTLPAHAFPAQDTFARATHSA